MKKILLVLLSACCTFLVACGGGGGGGEGGGSATGSESGTAAQYFSKTAVGNTWTTIETATHMIPGQPTLTSTWTHTSTISSFVNGVVSHVNTIISSSPDDIFFPATSTSQIDATGAMVTTDRFYTYLYLPATFSVGTTWTLAPADPAAGYDAFIATIEAFDVTRTVPAGTFSDCLQIKATFSFTEEGVTTTGSFTYYLSPTAGSQVELTGFSSSSNGETIASTMLLQPNYIANP